MKVAFFVSSLNGGGAERTMITIANGFASRGHAVSLVTARSGDDLASLIQPSLTRVQLDVRRTVGAVLPLAHYLRRDKPDVIVSAMDIPNMVAVLAVALANSSTHTVVTYHGGVTAAARASIHPFQRVRRPLARVVTSFAHHVVAVSHGVGDDLRLINRQLRFLSVIYNPTISDRMFIDAQAPVPDVLPPGDGPLVMAAGRLAPEKGFDTLIAAFALLRQSEPSARLLIIGEGPLRAELEAQARAANIADAISMPGFVRDRYPLMAICDSFVLTSRREGLGMVLVEAGALGAPLVSTDCPVGPEEILRGREQAVLVPVDDVETLAEELVRSLRKGRRAPSAEGWEMHTVTASVDAYEQLCHDQIRG